MKLAEIGYAKCDVARGVYLKTVADDIVRLYRHSDDFRLSCSKDETMDAEIEAIQSKIRMTPFAKLKKFLGCDFERYNSETMEKDDLGDIYLVTMVTQIDKLDREFEHLKREFNPKGKLRYIVKVSVMPGYDILQVTDLVTVCILLCNCCSCFGDVEGLIFIVKIV